MNEPVIRPSRSIGRLRFFAWAMPSCVAPFLVFAVFAFDIPFSWELALIAAIVALICLARFDALLQCQQQQIPPDDPRAKIGKRMATFVGVQFLLVPALWGAIVFVSVSIWGLPRWEC